MRPGRVPTLGLAPGRAWLILGNMCGRFVLPDEQIVGEHYRTVQCFFRGWFKPMFNVAPTAQVPVIVRAATGAWELRRARWGLIPAWWPKPEPPALTFNARSEDAARKPVWRDSLRSARCLMPARGWYEWMAKEPAGGAPRRRGRQPFFLHCPDSPVIAFAGLQSVWTGPDGVSVTSCALLTKPATGNLKTIHPRMPVVLMPDREAGWLDPAATGQDLVAMVADSRVDVESYPVGTRVNNIHNDGPDLMQRIPVATTGLLDLDAPVG